MRRGGDGLLRHSWNHECKQNRKVCTCGLHKDVGFIHRIQNVEARVGIEPTYKGFADLSLTTWVPRRSA